MSSFDFRAILASPVGPRTIHFWAPIANWGFVLATIADMQKPMERVSSQMTLTLMCYSAMFMRFAWRVAPRNYILFSCHTANATAQATLFYKKTMWLREQEAEKQRQIALALPVASQEKF